MKTTTAIGPINAAAALPRALFALALFVVFLLLAALVGYLGLPPLARDLTRLFTDFESIARELAQSVLGGAKVSTAARTVMSASRRNFPLPFAFFLRGAGWLHGRPHRQFPRPGRKTIRPSLA